METNSAKLRKLMDSLKSESKNSKNSKNSKMKNTINSAKTEKNEIKSLKKNLSYFRDYLLKIKEHYLNSFKNKYDDEINLTKDSNKKILEKFQEQMPFISGKKTINHHSIQIPNNIYFLNKLFNKILNLFIDKAPYPIIDKYGLVYFQKQEWIYFTIDEMNYQDFIVGSKNVMALLYKDYMNKKLDPNSFMAENDKYILPSTVKGYSFERSAVKYFQLKTNLKAAPDILIKLISKEEEKSSYADKVTFDEYFSYVKYNFIEIDGAFINNTIKDTKITGYNNIMISYEELVITKNKNLGKFVCIKNNYPNINPPDFLTIPKGSVVFLQTKSESPYIQLDSKNKENFDKQKLPWEEMKKELANVLYKMILSGKIFFELYNELNLIKKYYAINLFLIFDNFPINDITHVIKEYIDILIDKNLVNYQFTIRPLYINSSIEEHNFNINSTNLNKKIDELKKDSEKQMSDMKINQKTIEENVKKIQDLENTNENLLQKIKVMEDEINKLKNDKGSAKIEPSLQTKYCDERVKNYVLKIKNKVEAIQNKKYEIFDPIIYTYELSNNLHNYSIKVRVGEQQYIHIITQENIINESNINLIVLNRKNLWDPL